MIKHMGKENIFIWMEHNIMVSGEMINNMAMVLKHGLMELNMKEIMKMERNMELEHLNGQMDHSI